MPCRRAPWIRAGGRSVGPPAVDGGVALVLGDERPEVPQLAGHAPGAELTPSTTRPGRALTRDLDLERLQQVTTLTLSEVFDVTRNFWRFGHSMVTD